MYICITDIWKTIYLQFITDIIIVISDDDWHNCLHIDMPTQRNRVGQSALYDNAHSNSYQKV